MVSHWLVYWFDEKGVQDQGVILFYWHSTIKASLFSDYLKFLDHLKFSTSILASRG